MHKFGSTLIGFSIAWIVGVLIRMLAASMDSYGRKMEIYYVMLVFGMLMFWAGHWFRTQSKTKGVAKRIASAKSKWWGSDYGFRLSAFAAAAWAAGTLIWLDHYDRTAELVLGPVVAIFAVYFGYKHLVVGTAQTEAGPKPPVVDDMPNEDKAATTANTTLTETGERHAKSSADHEKAMDELIRRMKSDA